MDKDFNMCIDDECHSRGECFRYTAGPVKIGQAFFLDGSPRKDEDDKCDKFVSNRKRGKHHTFHKRVEKVT